MTAPIVTEQPPQPVRPPGSRLGVLVVLGSLTVAILAAVFAGVALDNALGGRLRDRAIWGVILMAAGVLGAVVAVLILVRRHSIIQNVRNRRWGAVAVFPGSFVALWIAAFLGYGIVGPVPRTAIIPFTPKFVVQAYPNGRVGFTTIGEFGGSFENRGERRTDGVIDGDIQFAYRVDPNVLNESAVTFEGTIKPSNPDRAEVRGTLVLKAKVRMRIEGMSDAKLTINDEPREAPVDLEPGTYRIAIQGTPRKE
jgi:hypothetical protein